MSIEQLITELIAALRENTAALQGKQPAPVKAPPAPVKTPPAPVVESQPSPPPSAPPQAENTATYEDVKAATMSLATAKGTDAVVAVLRQFGVDHAKKLKPEQWGEYVRSCKRAEEV